MNKETIKIPDIGGADSVEVIEICVAPGDRVDAEDSLIVLESDKASMEVPSPKAGKVVELKLKVGDSVSEGDAILVLELEGDAAAAPQKAREQTAQSSSDDKPQARSTPAEKESAPPQRRESAQETVAVPDIGGAEDVDVIEVCVKEGDEVAEGDSLIVLESDKASMEVPAPRAGKVIALKVREGDKVRAGSAILELAIAGENTQTSAPEEKPAATSPAREPARTPAAGGGEREAPAAIHEAPAAIHEAPAAIHEQVVSGETVYAGPAVRKLAREFGIDLLQVEGSGPKGRILKDDLQKFVKQRVKGGAMPAAGGTGIPAVPDIDFAKFGEVDIKPLSKLHKLTATNMHRSWLNVPHVTQFDDADISDLEDFRASLKKDAEARGVKLTPLPFLLKACAVALKANPKFNASLLSDGEHIVYKQYVHIGVAVDTPAGLVVPVIRDVDGKSIWELAAESAELAAKAKERKLSPSQMQGGCFTISSLGNIGGLGFTPIVNTPEVGILGVSKLTVKPVWNGSEFVPRKMLPLSLSYDHRAVNGADAGKFFTQLGELLADIRRLVL